MERDNLDLPVETQDAPSVEGSGERLPYVAPCVESMGGRLAALLGSTCPPCAEALPSQC